jgi:hypothetical protein
MHNAGSYDFTAPNLTSKTTHYHPKNPAHVTGSSNFQNPFNFCPCFSKFPSIHSYFSAKPEGDLGFCRSALTTSGFQMA